jgi:hypothetical protein
METAKSKAMRITIALFVVVLLTFFVPFGISQGMQNWASSASGTISGASVSEANSWFVYNMNGKSIPSTSTGSSATFFFPSNQSSAVVVTDLTVGHALNNDTSNISILVQTNVKETLTIYLAIGQSNTNYNELQYITITITNTSKPALAYFPGQGYWYSFPSTDHFIFIVTGATYGSMLTGSVVLKGVSGFESAFFNPQVWLSISLFFLGLVAFIGAIFAMPWIEMHPETIIAGRIRKKGVRK